MNFQSILDDIDKYVKLKTWLQFVGTALALIAFYFLPAYTVLQHAAKTVGVVGGFVALAGLAYDLIYP